MASKLRRLVRAADYGLIRLFSLLPVDRRCLVLQSTPDFSDSTSVVSPRRVFKRASFSLSFIAVHLL